MNEATRACLYTALLGGLLLGLAFMLAGCGDSEPTPPQKRMKVEDITGAVTRLFDKPTPQGVPLPVPRPEPPALAPHPQEPAVAIAAPPPTAAPAKPKPKADAQKPKAKRGKANGVAGYSCATIRMAGSAENVEQMAKARGHVVTPAIRRQIEACFNKG